MTAATPSRRTVRLADVAKLAGVSSQTVSRVVRGEPSVAEGTRRRVEKALRRLDYQPNLAARSLSNRRTNVVHVLNATPLFHGHARTFLSIVSRLNEYGFHASVSGAPKEERPTVSKLIPLGVDGVIVLGGHEDSVELAQTVSGRAPVVLVGQSQGLPDEIASVSIDQGMGARLAAEHLVAMGCRTLFHVAGPVDWQDSHDRLEGFRDACSRVGLEPGHRHAESWDSRSGHAVAAHIPEDVDGVFASNDQLALGVMRWLTESGRRIPGDVAVVGFDNAEGTDNFLPPLTTLRQRFRTVGELAVNRLMDLIEGRPAQHTQVAPTLVVRQSSRRN